MSGTPTKAFSPYPSFEDPPPRAISTDALLGKVVRRLFEDGSRREDGLAGTLRAVLVALDHGMAATGKPTR